MHCSQCGQANPAQARFCNGCGRPLANGPATASGERRQLTVLFADLVDSTAIAARLGPEDWSEAVRAFQRECGLAVERFEGHVAQYLGDGVMVYFGHPVAHENDAERAIRAGLRILDALGSLNERLERSHRVRLGVRLSAHTGPVVVEQMGGPQRSERLALGDTPNVAARLQTLAVADSLVVSAATLGLARGVFQTDDLGSHLLKGIAEPVAVHRVLGEARAPNLFGATASRGLSVLVGRDQEVELLCDRFELSRDGSPQLVLISGDPGIGKSRLAHELRGRLADTAHRWLDLQCASWAEHTPFWPVTELLRHELALDTVSGAADRTQRLEEGLKRAGIDAAEALPALAELLGLPPPMGSEPASAERVRETTFKTLVDWLHSLARRQPLVLLIEDLQWADPSTVELFDRQLHRAEAATLLVVATLRPEFEPPASWRQGSTTIALPHLTRSDAVRMIDLLSPRDALPAPLKRQLVEKSDGVPFFVEELLRSLHDASRAPASGSADEVGIPMALQDPLRARLDQVGEARETAQIASALGREFDYELLRAVAPDDEPRLLAQLDQLVDAEILYQRGRPPQASYVFKHALIQDAAYDSMLRRRRRELHQHVAEVIGDRLPELAQNRPELLARHYSEAGDDERAVAQWIRAGHQALRRSAHLEAIAHARRGVERLGGISDENRRCEHELVLQLILGEALTATDGFAGQATQEAFCRARALCSQHGEPGTLYHALTGMYGGALAEGRMASARELASQMLSIAQSTGREDMLCTSHHSMGINAYTAGELSVAREHFSAAVPYHERECLQGRVRSAGSFAESYLISTLWLCGAPDQARKRIVDCLARVRPLQQPFNLATVLVQASRTYLHCGDVDLAFELCDELCAIAEQQHYALYLACGLLVRGGALVERGQLERGLTELQRGLQTARDAGQEFYVTYFMPPLVEALALTGETGQALETAERWLARGRDRGVRIVEPELLRLRGELLAKRNESREQAEASLREALELAHAWGALGWELRAAVSWCRFLSATGRASEGRARLAAVYERFTEGFDTPDLETARALLA